MKMLRKIETAPETRQALERRSRAFRLRKVIILRYPAIKVRINEFKSILFASKIDIFLINFIFANSLKRIKPKSTLFVSSVN